MSLIASLPMYDWPENSAKWDRLWQAILRRLTAADIPAQPKLLRADDRHAVWTRPDLLLGQTCGWPYVTGLASRVTVLGQFDFGLDTARSGDYYSVLIARRGEGRTAAELLADPAVRVAVNDFRSQSGFRVLGVCCRQPVKAQRERILLTGSHRFSVIAVAQRRADIAAIDANSWCLAQQFEPACETLEVIDRSPDMPGLPLIMANELAVRSPLVFAACAEAISELGDNGVSLKAIVPASAEDYRPLSQEPFGCFAVKDA